MNYLQAIKLLAPYHTAQLVWVVPTEHTNTTNPTGQLTTGLAATPLLAVNNGQVIADDLFDVLDSYAHPTQLNPINSPTTYVSSLYGQDLPYGLVELV